MPTFRDHVITDFQNDASVYDKVFQGRIKEQTGLRYYVLNHELSPSTNRKHLQVFVQFDGPTSLKRLKELFGAGIHAEPRRGTVQECIDYCSKTETRVVGTTPTIRGRIRTDGVRGGSDRGDAIEDLKSHRSLRRIASEHSEFFVRSHRGLVALLQQTSAYYSGPRHVIVVIGEPGCGKTRWVYDNVPDDPERVYWKDPTVNNYFDGYAGQEIAIIDDFGGWIPYTTMLRIMDRYRAQVDVKGTYAPWNVKTLIITSNREVNHWWKEMDDIMLQATSRRFGDVLRPPASSWPTLKELEGRWALRHLLDPNPTQDPQGRELEDQEPSPLACSVQE